VVSGQTFDAFLQQRCSIVGMKDTTFYLTDAQLARRVPPTPSTSASARSNRAARGPTTTAPAPPAAGNGGLYSTAPDYARFCQMLLGGGTFAGHRYLGADAMKFSPHRRPATFPRAFSRATRFGHYGTNYGWGSAHASAPAAPRRGRGALARHLRPRRRVGTQAWIDPVKGVAYVLMVQRSNFLSSDASEVRAPSRKPP